GKTFATSKTIEHLQTCQARLSAKQEGHTQRLFHVFVEGTYRPSYWMHLELPVAATLADLDDFLRTIWLECCGHLSEFTIKDTAYASVSEDDWSVSLGLAEEEEVGVNGGPDQGQPSAEAIATQIADTLSTELHADLKDVPISQIEEKLVEMLSENLPPGVPSLSSPEFRPFLNYMATALQQGRLAEEIEDMEEMEEDEAEMDATLDEVLSVGETFSYIYDFGSSTNLSLRIVAEREGAIPTHLIGEGEEENTEATEDEHADLAIIVMARNEPPKLLCHLCGQPATYVAAEYDALDEACLCAEHARQQDDPDELLPVVNSPRVGVCGYTGEEDEDMDWEEEEDE
ncbi:MAG: hypothetical protein ACRDHW_10375, partial [Ktedonobacteraceae bacterium]